MWLWLGRPDTAAHSARVSSPCFTVQPDTASGHHAAEAVGNHWGPQRAAHCSCSQPLRTSEGTTLLKKTSEGSTLQKKLWGTTEDLRGQYPAEEAVRNHWGPQRAVPSRRSCGEPLKTSEGRTLQKKLWGTTEDFRGQHTVLINCEEPPRTCTGCSGSQHQQVSSSDNIAIKRLNRWLDFSMVVSKKRFHWSRNSSSFPTRHNTSSDMSQHPALPAAFRGRPEAAARTAAPARCSPAVLLAVIPPGTAFPSAAPHPCAGFPTGRPQWPASQQQVKISAEYI